MLCFNFIYYAILYSAIIFDLLCSISCMLITKLVPYFILSCHNYCIIKVFIKVLCTYKNVIISMYMK